MSVHKYLSEQGALNTIEYSSTEKLRHFRKSCKADEGQPNVEGSVSPQYVSFPYELERISQLACAAVDSTTSKAVSISIWTSGRR